MGRCQYRFNPSELYQRTTPGTAPETNCGAETFPAVDEPEVFPVHHPDGRVEHRKTGRFIPRPYDDPHCPEHGGSPEPPPIPVTAEQVEFAAQQFAELAKTFRDQGMELPSALTDAYEIATGKEAVTNES